MTELKKIEFETVVLLIKQGLSLQRIHELTGVPYSKIEKNFSSLIMTYKSLPLGHKDEPYYEKEDDMLSLPQYSYESLSEDEKKIFHASYRES